MTRDVIPLVVGIREASVLLDISTKSVWRMIGKRELATTIVGKTKKIKVAEIERYLEKNTIPARKVS